MSSIPFDLSKIRAFVLAPLAEVAPDWRNAEGQGADALLRRLDRAGLSLLHCSDLADE